MKATYNITDDKLKVWFDERLSKEEYDLARRYGFTFWHGRKCFAAKWSTQAEDWILGKGITIEADDAPDDVESRVERFAGYAQGAEQSAAASETYLNEHANTERRRENAINGIEKNLSAAEHWQERIRGAIRHAQYKERPDVIARRIDGLEKDKRKFTADSTPDLRVDGAQYGAKNQVWVGAGRGGHWVEKDKLPAIQAWAARWVEHLNQRLEYERACLEAAGGIVAGVGVAPLDRVTFQKDGAIQKDGEWFLITKVNKRTVEYFTPRSSWKRHWKCDRTEIKDVRSPEQVRAEMRYLLDTLQAYNDAHTRREAMERDHAATLDEMSRPRGYASLGEYDKQAVLERLAVSLQAEQKEKVAA